MSGLYKEYSGVIIVAAVVLPVLFAMFHFFVYGAKGVVLEGNDNGIQRFSLVERIYHFFRMVAFILVAATGVGLVFVDGGKALGLPHMINGMVLLVFSIITLFVWFKPGLFTKHDGLWFKQLGGYFSKQEGLPAGKFNAGQKLFFWLSVVFPLVLTMTGVNLVKAKSAEVPVNESVLALHGILAALFTLLVLGHVYLSVGANRGTWRVLTKGKVSEAWIESHHPNWEVRSSEKE